VAHDLRSPVGAILNFVTVLELDHGARLDEDARQVMKRIRSSAEAGLSLLDALSRLAGRARPADRAHRRRAAAAPRLPRPRPGAGAAALRREPRSAVADAGPAARRVRRALRQRAEVQRGRRAP
jgi:signal transduction histidine kinase